MSQEEQNPIVNPHIIRSGRLDVGDGHKLYWVDWGNQDIEQPIFFLHGGPGGGFDEKHFDNFDPQQHRVVFHDQRGSGRSTPFASTSANTTAHLLDDITSLKDELGFERISLFGFSWGSTLALLYAIKNPELIDKMLIGGIFLARPVDRSFYLKGGVKSHFPEVWQRFADNVPSDAGAQTAEYYQSKMKSPDDQERKKFAKEWMLYEASTLKLDYNAPAIERSLGDFASESLSYLEAHYILNGCFIGENHILDNAHQLKNIETIIVHGRYDFICMPSAAYELQQTIGDNAMLHIVTAGHSTSDTVQREVIRAYTHMLWR